MKRMRIAAIAFVLALAAAAVLAPVLAPAPYARQYRELSGASCSRQHPLGTDDLGRDRLSRLLYGTRVSLALAPAAAFLATVLAAVAGVAAGLAGGWIEACLTSAADLLLSMPWLFLLITVRALLPLNVPPAASVAITFALLGCLGWAGASRILCAETRVLRNSEFVLLARASGCGPLRILRRQIAPNLRATLQAQFLLSIPAFILSEANLSLLGLGVAEPLPSWGSLLRELEGLPSLASDPVRFVPMILLVLTVGSFQILLRREECLS